MKGNGLNDDSSNEDADDLAMLNDDIIDERISKKRKGEFWEHEIMMKNKNKFNEFLDKLKNLKAKHDGSDYDSDNLDEISDDDEDDDEDIDSDDISK